MEIQGNVGGRDHKAKGQWKGYDTNLAQRFHGNVVRICIDKGIMPSVVMAGCGIPEAAFAAMGRGTCPVLFEDAIAACRSLGCSFEELAR